MEVVGFCTKLRTSHVDGPLDDDEEAVKDEEEEAAAGAAVVCDPPVAEAESRSLAATRVASLSRCSSRLRSAGSSKVELAAAAAELACSCSLLLTADGAILLLRFMPPITVPPLIAANDFSRRLASFLLPNRKSNCILSTFLRGY